MGLALVRLVVTVGAVAMLAACGGSGPAAPDAGDSGPIAVVASTDVWASVATAVGGDEVTVKAIVANPAGDPHSYQVSAKDAAELRGARLVLSNGGGYDDFVDKALNGAIGPGGPRWIKATELMPAPKRSAHDQEDPHVWYDLPTVATVADQLAKHFGDLRPAAKAEFAANAGQFATKLDGLEATLDELAGKHGDTAIAATEPVAHYLLDAVGLTDATPREFVEAIEEETDPPAGAVAEVQRLVTERRVALLVHNPQTETPMVGDLVAKARAAGIPVVEMTETLAGKNDYLAWMGNQIRALSEALAQASARR